MTHEDAGHYAAKHTAGTEPDPGIRRALERVIKDGAASCAALCRIADDLHIPPAEVGVAADLMEVRVTRCQMGLFGYTPESRIIKPTDEVSSELEGAIRESLVDGRIPCLSSWQVARRFGVAKMDVARACETLHIKISSCQLGAF